MADDGVGARLRAFVTVDGLPREYLRAVAGRPWRLAHDGYRVHFGLGPATWVDSLIIEWPQSGRRTIVGLHVDSLYAIPEDPEIVGAPPAPAWSGSSGASTVAFQVVPNTVVLAPFTTWAIANASLAGAGGLTRGVLLNNA